MAAEGRTHTCAGFHSLLFGPARKVSPELVFYLSKGEGKDSGWGPVSLQHPPLTPKGTGEACRGPNRYLGRGKQENIPNAFRGLKLQ